MCVFMCLTERESEREKQLEISSFNMQFGISFILAQTLHIYQLIEKKKKGFKLKIRKIIEQQQQQQKSNFKKQRSFSYIRMCMKE